MVVIRILTSIALVAMMFPVASTRAAETNIGCSTAKLIVPWGAGGGTDVIFRQFVESANKTGMEPQLQVVNIPGQGGNKGAKEAQKSRPDGCTLFAMHQSVITSYFTGRINFTWDAFDPIARLTLTPSIIGANGDVPYNDLPGLIKAAKANPEKITAGGTFGSVSQFVFLLLEDAAGIKFRHVSYDGTKERNTALLAKNIDLGEINLTSAKKYIELGDLKALAITSPQRSNEIPKVKTTTEQGINLIYGVERGVMVPKGTPKEIIAHYELMFRKAAEQQELIASLGKKGTEVQYLGADDYRASLVTTYDKWLSIAKDVGVYKR